jgi:hypothetical protein
MFFKKKKSEEIAAKRTNYAGESVDKLDKDGNLPWGWYAAHKEFTDERTTEYTYFLDNYCEARSKSPLEKYETLKSLVLYLEDAKKLCYSKGECFAKWYDDIIASPEHIRKLQLELSELESNFHGLQDEWELRQKLFVGLDEKVWKIITDNDGIMQTDLLKMFDACVKNDITNFLYHWDKEGKIERIKSGRSYALHIKGQK